MLEQLKNRRSCRKFNSEKKVETDKIQEVVDAGLYASNGMGYQNGIIIVITNKEIEDHELFEKQIIVPKEIDLIESMLVIVKCQLIAYYVAKLNGCDIDKPRNLAKSVTVE